MPWCHVAEPSWCKCGKCCKMPKDDENVCCVANPCRSDAFKEYLEEQTSTQPNLEEWKDQFLQQETEEARSVYNSLSTNGKFRRLCYWKASFYFHVQKWYPQDSHDDVKYTALPSCIVWLVRRRFEEKEKGAYTGFPPKLELLQDVVEARKTFEDRMNQCGTAVRVANPRGGLLTTFEQLESPKQLNKVYDVLLRASGAPNDKAACLKQQWADSTGQCIGILPMLGLVACATVFEAFVHEMFKRCCETIFSTRIISEIDATHWLSWLNRRMLESIGWNREQHQKETGFWEGFEPTKDVCMHLKRKIKEDDIMNYQRLKTSNCVLRELTVRKGEIWSKILKHLKEDPLSQQAVGLMQEMVDTRQQAVVQNVNNTIDCIQEGFRTLAKLAQPGEKTNRKRKSQNKPYDKKTRMRMSGTRQDQLSMSTSSSMSSIDIIDPSMPGDDITTPLKTSTPLREPSAEWNYRIRQTGTTRTKSDEEIAIEHQYLITYYCGMYPLQISISGSAYDVKCGDAKTLSYLSNLYYGLRNFFCHGSPEKTAVVGAMRADRIPAESSDLNITTAEPDLEASELCKNHLFDLFTNANEQMNLMEVDYDLFLTAQSFYAYAVKVIGSVAACIAYRYGDEKLREKAKLAVTREMLEIEAAWKFVDEQIDASKTTPFRISDESQSVPGTEEKVERKPSTGITQDFSEFTV